MSERIDLTIRDGEDFLAMAGSLRLFEKLAVSVRGPVPTDLAARVAAAQAAAVRRGDQEQHQAEPAEPERKP